MNVNDVARVSRLQDLAVDEARARQRAFTQAKEYSDKFDDAFSTREIRRAGETAHWINIIFPLIKSGRGISR